MTKKLTSFVAECLLTQATGNSHNQNGFKTDATESTTTLEVFCFLTSGVLEHKWRASLKILSHN